MRFYLFLLMISLFFTACGGNNETPKNNAGNTVNPSNSNLPKNVNLPNSNQAAGNNVPNSVAKTPEPPKVNDAKTLSLVVAAYSDALKTKNDAALRKVLSQSAVKGWEDAMKEEKRTKLAEYVAENEYVEGKPFEIRNEEIKGDEATAEMKGGVYGVWSKIGFSKENGEWKFNGKSDDISEVKSAANTAQKIVK
jgi:hypothetical protein